jgi:hypothetical protein
MGRKDAHGDSFDAGRRLPLVTPHHLQYSWQLCVAIAPDVVKAAARHCLFPAAGMALAEHVLRDSRFGIRGPYPLAPTERYARHGATRRAV